MSLIFIKQAEELRENGDVRSALRALEAGLRENPTLTSAKFVRAKCHADLRRFADALHELDEILQSTPDHLKARKLKVEIYLLLNQHNAALRDLTSLVDRYPQDVEAARALEKLEDFIYGKMAGAERVTRASSDRRLSGFQEARAVAMRHETEEFEEEPAIATRTIAELYLRQGLQAKAIKVLQKILQENSADIWAMTTLDKLENESRLPSESNSATTPDTVKARKIRVLERMLERVQLERLG
jgi:tetratricopeptide (TPR) repeat protein